MKTQTAEQRATIMAGIINGAANTLVNLKGRWMDEREYEDFNDYIKVITEAILKVAPEGTKVLKVTKAFKILLEVPEFPYNPQISCTTTSLGWTSVKK